MATEDKKIRNRDLYIRALKEGREEYEKRKEYLASFRLPMAEESEEVEVEEGEEKAEEGSAVKDEGVFIEGTGDDTRGMIALGKTKMKAAYVFGSAGPTVFDCSGFVHWVYSKCGYEFPRGTAKSQYDLFKAVSDPKVGDLIYFSNTYKPGISHVGIWIGNNQMLHTANVANGVQISELSDWWKAKKPEWRSPEAFYKGDTPMNGQLRGEAKASSFARIAEIMAEAGEGDGEVYPPASEIAYYESKKFAAPYIGSKFLGETLVQPKTSRSAFLHSRIGWVHQTKMSGLKHLNKNLFIHQHHYDGYEGNLYSPDAKRLFESLLLKTKKPYFEVISGFRFSNKGQLSPHEAGCAIDIQVRTIEEVREIADCAWQLGIRSIAMGGDLDQKKGFIHLDIAPKGKNFKYEGTPIYGGPGKWEIK